MYAMWIRGEDRGAVGLAESRTFWAAVRRSRSALRQRVGISRCTLRNDDGKVRRIT